MKIEVEYFGDDYYIAVLEDPVVAEIADPWYHESYEDTDGWCTDTFGQTDWWGEPPVNGWKRMRNKYYFTTKSSCELFVLRWS